MTRLATVIVTGSPGTGKTTLAAQLAKAHPRGLHLPADVFFTFPAHPLSPYRAEAREQNTDLMIALARTAATFASLNYQVVMDGIFGPWFLPVIAKELQTAGIDLDYVVLTASLETALRRVQARDGRGRDHVVRQMHAQFSDLGPYSGHRIDTTALTPENVVAEITRQRAAGAFKLNLTEVAARGVG